MQKYVLDRNGNTVATFASDYNDKHTKTLEAGASTYEFTISKLDSAALYLETGNYINFVDDVGKPWSFSILSYTETHNEKTVYCEDVGIELINKNVNAYKADAAYSFAFYFEMIMKNTPWTIGINEISDLSRKLEWTSNDTGLSRLLSLLTEFDNAECKFNVKFKRNQATEFKVDIYKQIGNPQTNVQIVYSNELNDITKTESRAEFVTAIQGEGGTPTKNADGTDIVTGTNPDGTTIETPKITFADIEYKDDNYVSAKGDNFLRAVTANKLFNPNAKDVYLEGYYSYDTESAQELLNRTLTQLKKYSAPQYTYEADVQVIDKSLDLGDTVKIIDHDYKPGLYLEARVASLEKSYTDPSKNTITFTNYRLVNSSLAQKLADLQNIINSMPTASGVSSIVTNVINNSNVIEQKILALQSADGRSTVYYDAKPSNAKEGDTAFVKNPDSGNMEIWNYVGDQWTLTAGDATFDDLKTQIDKAKADAQTAITTANTAVSTANDNAAKFGTDIATLKTDVTKSVADVGAKADTAIDNANAVKLTAEKALESADGANSSITEINTTVDDLKGTMATKADSSSIDAANGRIETLNSQVWQNSQDIKLSAKATDVNTLTGRVTTAEGLITTNANQIKNAVTKTELTTAKSEWSSAQSTITAGQIATEITKVNQTITDKTTGLVSQTVLNNAITTSETGTKQVISESVDGINNKINIIETTAETNKQSILDMNGNITTALTTAQGAQTEVQNAATKTEVTQLANQLTSTVSDLNYGNQLKNTVDFKGWTHWNEPFIWHPNQDDIWFYRATTNLLQKQGIISKGGLDFKQGDDLTLSFVVKTTFADLQIYVMNDASGKNTVVQHFKGLAEGDTFISFTFKAPSYAGGNTSIAWLGNGDDPVGAYVQLKGSTAILTKGTTRVPWKEAATDNTSQLTQTQSMIDARVEKNGVVNAINISPEAILINGNKVHITGQTTIDSGIITNAMIGNATIEAAKIKDGAITNAKIANLDGGKITANSITADKLAVNAILVGLNGALGKVTIEPDLISVSQGTSAKATKLDMNGIHFTDANGNDVGFFHSDTMMTGDGGVTLSGNLLVSQQFEVNQMYAVNKSGKGAWVVRDTGAGIGMPGFGILNASQNGGIFFADDDGIWLGDHGSWKRVDNLQGG